MEIYQKVPRATIDLLVVSNNGFLLTKRSITPFKGMWHTPGGTVLFKEPIKHAIARIAKEELNVTVQIVKQLGMVEILNEGRRHAISNCFLVKIKSGELKVGKQGTECRFFKKPPQNTIAQQKAFINKHLSNI